MKSNDFPKRLYIVATPIGNLSDISQRTIETLSAVDLICCENTEHSLRLLNHFGIRPKKIKKLTDHESDNVIQTILSSGADTIALISDAGTPLISDPGHRLVALARQAGYGVLAVPGPSAVLAALSICPFNTMPFRFMGFLSRKKGERLKVLAPLKDSPEALVLFESPRRLLALFDDLIDVFGDARRVFVAKELTKRFECTWSGAMVDVAKQIGGDAVLGEHVVIISAVDKNTSTTEEPVLPVSQVIDAMINCGISAHSAKQILGPITPMRKNQLYDLIMQRHSGKKKSQ